MKGREFLESARTLLAVGGEDNWRTAAGRSYYALLHEGETALTRWGFPKPPGEQLHQFVRRRFNFTPHPDLRQIGGVLDVLSNRRNQADYQLSVAGPFATDVLAGEAVRVASTMIALLDAIEADPAREAAVIVALRTAWP